MFTMKPGRYEVRGGPGGRTAVCRITKPRDYAQIGRDHHTDRWQVLTSVRIPAGASVTHYGILRAVARVWELA